MKLYTERKIIYKGERSSADLIHCLDKLIQSEKYEAVWFDNILFVEELKLIKRQKMITAKIELNENNSERLVIVKTELYSYKKLSLIVASVIFGLMQIYSIFTTIENHTFCFTSFTPILILIGISVFLKLLLMYKTDNLIVELNKIIKKESTKA